MRISFDPEFELIIKLLGCAFGIFIFGFLVGCLIDLKYGLILGSLLTACAVARWIWTLIS